MATSDRYGLEITTTSAKASERFQDGMDRLLSYRAGAEESFASALAADPSLAVAHTGLALLALVQGDAATARAAAGRARESVTGATRRERQHVEALSALIAGETARGLALVDEHVREFPRDAVVANQAGNAIALAGGSDREEYRVAFMSGSPPPTATTGGSSPPSPSRTARSTGSRSHAGSPSGRWSSIRRRECRA